MNSLATNLFSRLSPWIWIPWFAIALVDGSQTVYGMYAQGMQHAWVRLFAMVVLSWSPWPIATPTIIELGTRFPIERRRLTHWLMHAAAVMLFTAVWAAWTSLLDRAFDPWLAPGPTPNFRALFSPWLYRLLIPAVVLYALVIAISNALFARERLSAQAIETARLNEQLANSKLTALRQQLEPHFLFNTLNSIVVLIRESRAEDAVRATIDLSELLREVVRESDRLLVPLSEELALLTRYLDIQKLRFGSRLAVSLDVADNIGDIPIPRLLLQPLVENAIKHGIAKLANGGQIRISCSRRDAQLALAVFNDAPAPEVRVDSTSNTHVGIVNLRKRLELLYGQDFELQMQRVDPNGFEVSLMLGPKPLT